LFERVNHSPNEKLNRRKHWIALRACKRREMTWPDNFCMEYGEL